ncbi:MAG: hypothetical protein HC862_32350 [Scytonema sp. RU_4_4]|nr:hypothetical protein [Scytonema sp. RU_4_4]
MKIAIRLAPNYWLCELQRVRDRTDDEKKGKESYQKGVDEYNAPSKRNNDKAITYLNLALRAFQKAPNKDCENEVKSLRDSILKSPSPNNSKLKNPSPKCRP